MHFRNYFVDETDSEGKPFISYIQMLCLPRREEVEALMEACKAHLERSDDEILKLEAWIESVHAARKAYRDYLNSRKPLKEKAKGYVYLMKNSRNGLVKIGFSRDPQSREGTLQSEEPEIDLYHAFEGTMDEETALHREYAAKRTRGEWFKLNDDDLTSITSRFPA